VARASTHTLLSLDRYAKIMGITPPHFNQGANASFFNVGKKCNDIWYQYDWQNSKNVSRETLARAIREAEDSISSVIGYYPAPRWISKEMHRYPQLYRREFFGNGKDIRGKFKSIDLRHGKFIAAGRRNTTLVGDSIAVVYSDPNGVGFNDTATITVAGITATAEVCELKVFFEDKSGEQEWEIRDPRSKTLVAGTLTVVFDSWQLIDPDLWEAYPTTEALDGIDFTDTSNLVTEVDVYREFTDFTQASAEFSFEPKPRVDTLSFLCTSCSGTGCTACELTIQNGCLHPRDVELGQAVPQPATYSASDEQWNEDQWTECREPDNVKVWYYAGDLDEKYLREVSCDPLSHWFAEAIAWLATARLTASFCACGNIENFALDLRRDLAHIPSDGDSFLLSENNLGNPFGTKKGEIMAWNRIANLTEIIPDLALV
jgi:hypothetical protein